MTDCLTRRHALCLAAGVGAALAAPRAAGASGERLTVGAVRRIYPVADLLLTRFQQSHREIGVVNRVSRQEGLGLPWRDEGTALIVDGPLADRVRKQVRRRYGVELVRLRFAAGAVVVVVNESNPVAFDAMSMDELERVFSGSLAAGVDPIDLWRDFGLERPWTARTIAPYVSERREGLRNFQRIVLGGLPVKASIARLSGDPRRVVGNAVARNASGIGLVEYGKPRRGIEVVPVRPAGAGADEDGVLPTDETIADGSYPLAYPLYLYHAAPGDGAASGAVQALSDFLVGPQARAAIGSRDYVQVPPE